MATINEIVQQVLAELQNSGTKIRETTIVDKVTDVANVLGINEGGQMVRISPDSFNKGESQNAEAIQTLRNDIITILEQLGNGQIPVGLAFVAEAVKNGSITKDSLTGELRDAVSAIDNLETESVLQPLSANQGVVLKSLIDALSRKTVYLTKEQYKDLETNGEIISDVEYNILEDE